MFVIKFENQDCWIAPWEGDPGRTLKMENAKQYKNELVAEKSLHEITKNNPHRKMKLIIQPVTHK